MADVILNGIGTLPPIYTGFAGANTDASWAGK